MKEAKIGDKIRDIEDGDCYFEGVVTRVSPLQYLLNRIVWNGEEEPDSNLIGQEITPRRWFVKKVNEQ